MDSSYHKSIALQGLKGNWFLAAVANFIAAIFGATIISSGFSSNTSSVNQSVSSLQLDTETSKLLLSILSIVALIFIVLTLTLGGVIVIGYARYQMDLVYGQKPSISLLFENFHRFQTGFCFMFLRGLYVFLWSLLFVIPGIIAAFSYAMAPYILAEFPEMTASEALAESKRIMDGNKFRLFCLGFSFIGWAILCAFTLGIGVPFLGAYIESAGASFYFEITGRPLARY